MSYPSLLSIFIDSEIGGIASGQQLERDQLINDFLKKARGIDRTTTINAGALRGSRAEEVRVDGEREDLVQLTDAVQQNPFAQFYVLEGERFDRMPDGSWHETGQEVEDSTGLTIVFGSSSQPKGPQNGSAKPEPSIDSSRQAKRLLSPTNQNTLLGSTPTKYRYIETGTTSGPNSLREQATVDLVRQQNSVSSKSDHLTARASEIRSRRIMDAYSVAVNALDNQYTKTDYINKTRHTATFYARARNTILKQLWLGLIIHGPQAASNLVNSVSTRVLKKQGVDPFNIRRVDIVAPQTANAELEKAINSLPFTIEDLMHSLALPHQSSVRLKIDRQIDGKSKTSSMDITAATRLFEIRTGRKLPDVPQMSDEEVVTHWRSDYGRIIPYDVAAQLTGKPYISAATAKPEDHQSILANGPERLQGLILHSLGYSKDVENELAKSVTTKAANFAWQLSQQMIPVFRELSAIEQLGSFLDRAEKVTLLGAAREYVGDSWRSISFWDPNLTSSERLARGLSFALALKGAKGQAVANRGIANLGHKPAIRKLAKAFGVAEGDIAVLAAQANRNAAGSGSRRPVNSLQEIPQLSEQDLQHAGTVAYKNRARSGSASSEMPTTTITSINSESFPPGLRTVLDNPDLIENNVVTAADLRKLGITRQQALSMASNRTRAAPTVELKSVIERIKDKKDPKGVEKLLRGLMVAVGAIEKHHMIPRAVAKRLKKEFGLDLTEYNWVLELEYKVHRAYHAGSGYRYRGGAYNNAFMERIDLLVDNRKEITRSEILSILDEVQAQFPKSSK